MTKFNLDKLREVAEPRKEKPDFLEKNKMNAIDYWYKKYMALKETERIPKPELTIQDIELLHTFLYAVKNNKHGAFTFTRLSDEQYLEVLNRFNKSKEKK